VDPINEAIGEDNEQRKLEKVIPASWPVRRRIIHFGIPADFSEEKGQHTESHSREGTKRLLDFQRNLALEVFRVLECGLIENEVIGEPGRDEIYHDTEKPGGL